MHRNSCRLVLLLALSVSTGAVALQRPKDPEAQTHQFMFNPVDALVGATVGVGAIRMDYRVALSRYVGLSAAPSFAFAIRDDITAFGAGLEAGPRFLFHGSLRGAYIYAFASGTWLRGEDDTANTTLTGWAVGAGLEAGYVWTWENGLALSLGGGVVHLTFLGDLSDIDLGELPLLPRVNFSVGYGF